MKLLPGGPLSAAVCIPVATAFLMLPACSNTSHVAAGTDGGRAGVSGTTTNIPGHALYRRVNSRYFHCHPDGTCHNARDSDYGWIGGRYRPSPPPIRPRPL